MITAVIPGHNEESSVKGVIEKVYKYVDEVVYVDDGSKDNSVKEAKKTRAKIVELTENQGKGAALRRGFSESVGDILVTLDSDGQHDPSYIPEFIKNLKNNDMVIGSRYAGKFYTVPRNVLGNFGLNFLTNMFSYGPQGLPKWVGDTQSGFRAFRRSALKDMNLEAKSYEIESEIIFEAAKNKLKIKEIPIIVSKRIEGVTVKDGLEIGVFMFKKRFCL